MKHPFTEDYFLRGEALGLSNYTDYRWMGEPTIRMAVAMQRYLGVSPGHTLLDYGCARGYLVKAFRILGVNAFGQDISEWAIAHCDEEARPYVKRASHPPGPLSYDWVVAKDVLEHIAEETLRKTARALADAAARGLFAVVPLAGAPGGEYVAPRDNSDRTHVIRWTLEGWLDLFGAVAPRHIVNGSFNVPGIKQAAEPYPHSCGFITVRRP